MKVLFVTAREATDHLASCLWDGLQEVLGEENVVDAVDHRCLHAPMAHESVYRDERDDSRFGRNTVLTAISGRRNGKILHNDETGFDLLILNAAFLRAGEFDWHFARRLTARLRPGAKVVYVEGWDSAHEVHPPEMHVDAVFRKEIDPSHRYPYDCRHLTFAAPARWFDESDIDCPRPRDVFYSGTTHSNPMRFGMLSAVFQTRHRHESIVASSHMCLSVADYFAMYRRSKLALCPSSAERADSLRTYEAVACGSIPIFVDYPPWHREEWLDGYCFFCGSDGVADHIDAALDRDLPAMRKALWHHARKNHTTRARAEKLLRSVGAL